MLTKSFSQMFVIRGENWEPSRYQSSSRMLEQRDSCSRNRQVIWAVGFEKLKIIVYIQTLTYWIALNRFDKDIFSLNRMLVHCGVTPKKHYESKCPVQKNTDKKQQQPPSLTPAFFLYMWQTDIHFKRTQYKLNLKIKFGGIKQPPLTLKYQYLGLKICYKCSLFTR